MLPNPQSTATYTTHIVLHITDALLIVCFTVMKFQVMEEKKDLTRNGKFVHLSLDLYIIFHENCS